MDGRFRHHALATRRFFPHSGEDYGSVNKTHEDTITGGRTYAERQRERTRRSNKKFRDFWMKDRGPSSKKPGLPAKTSWITNAAVDAAMMI